MTAAPRPHVPTPHRRWLQFSLRTLVVLMLVLGCGLGWLAREVKRVRGQRKAAAAIEELGGSVVFETVSDGRLRMAVVWLGKLFGEDLSGDVTLVALSGTQVTDAELTHLRGLTRLEILDLSKNRVTDAGLVHLQSLTQLYWVAINRTQVSDAGLVHLRGLTQLVHLQLSNTQVTDAGVAELQEALPNVTVFR